MTATRRRTAAVIDSPPADTDQIELPSPPSLPEPRPLPEPPPLPESVEASSGSAAPVNLTFDTGPIVTVFGTGLLGRRPVAEPGERFDQLVPIDDPGRSVSKTHLEFGLAAGRLWICDRFSGNGTILYSSDGDAKLCEPGRRFRVEYGWRVAIGDLSFTVS